MDNFRAVLLSIAKSVVAGLDPCIAEAKAIVIGMQLAVEAGLLPTMVESDSLSVINLISFGVQICSDIGLIIEDIAKLKLQHEFSSFIFSPRASNNMAHSFAKMAVSHAIDVILIEDVPPNIRSLVQEEAIFP
ncbi:hypothetical protein ACOSQ4_009778 [Xanthoceras sorbifolium]